MHGTLACQPDMPVSHACALWLRVSTLTQAFHMHHQVWRETAKLPAQPGRDEQLDKRRHTHLSWIRMRLVLLQIWPLVQKAPEAQQAGHVRASCTYKHVPVHQSVHKGLRLWLASAAVTSL